MQRQENVSLDVLGRSNRDNAPTRDDKVRNARRRVKQARKANRQRRPRRTTGVRS